RKGHPPHRLLARSTSVGDSANHSSGSLLRHGVVAGVTLGWRTLMVTVFVSLLVNRGWLVVIRAGASKRPRIPVWDPRPGGRPVMTQQVGGLQAMGPG